MKEEWWALGIFECGEIMDIEFKLNREREEDQMGLMHWERIEVFKKTIVEVDKGSWREELGRNDMLELVIFEQEWFGDDDKIQNTAWEVSDLE